MTAIDFTAEEILSQILRENTELRRTVQRLTFALQAAHDGAQMNEALASHVLRALQGIDE